jgi:hypothetical protein
MKRHRHMSLYTAIYRALALLLVVAMLPRPADAQVPSAVQLPQVVIEGYDLDSTTYVYPFSGPLLTGNSRVVTAGSSTTVTASAGTPFTSLSIGDRIIVTRGDNTVDARTVATCVPACGPTATSITVTAAVDWTGGFPWSWRRVTAGAGIGDGWYACAKTLAGSCLWVIQVDQQNTTTGIDFRLECELNVSTGHAPISVFERAAVTVAGIGTVAAPGRFAVDVVNPFDRCRLGIKLTSTDDGGDTGANAEIINVYTRTR